MGYLQIHGVDYDEVFSPTLCLETLRLLYSLMAVKSWTSCQVDFKTVFLNGDVDKPISWSNLLALKILSIQTMYAKLTALYTA